MLDVLGLRPGRITVLKDVPPGNGSWLVEMPGGQRAVLRRYHAGASPRDLEYEHAVLGHLAGAGWVVPGPAGDPVCHDGLWYCLTRYVPGKPAARESPGQRRRRGCDLARLHLALRELGQRIGQRPSWRPQRSAITIQSGLDWQACVRALLTVSPRFGSWAQAAAGETLYRAFRLGMAAWEFDHGLTTGEYDLAAIERNLSRTGTPAAAPRHIAVSLIVRYGRPPEVRSGHLSSAAAGHAAALDGLGRTRRFRTPDQIIQMVP